MSYFLDNIDDMAAYVPGEQPSPEAKVVKLNTNENAYPPSPKAMEVLREFDGGQLRLYPDPTAGKFRQAVSKVLDVPADWVLPGNGSDDLIMMIARSCLGLGKKAVFPVPTFEFYLIEAVIQGAEIVEVPFGEDFSLPTAEIIKAAGAVTFIASPNSPSGTLGDNAQLEELASQLEGLLVIDEAYADFADGNALELTRTCDNVIVLRTLSKGYSLAGMRLGFGIANPSILEGLCKTKAIYNVDALACAVGAAAFDDQSHKTANAAKIKASRQRLTEQLTGLDFRVWPSQANFLFVRPAAGNAEDIYQTLKAQGILVRYFNRPELSDKLRITIGTDQQNDALIGALSDL